VKTKIIEAESPQGNWGKFLVGQFDTEWEFESAVGVGRPVMGACGWQRAHILVLDLQTGEGGIFLPYGLASADLRKHKVWVCPLFEPFLTWLYTQDLTDVDELPSLIVIEHDLEWQGYRRPGRDLAGERDQLLEAARRFVEANNVLSPDAVVRTDEESVEELLTAQAAFDELVRVVAEIDSPRIERIATTAEVAKSLGVSPASVQRWAREGAIPYDMTAGGHRRFNIHEVHQALAI
jgi:excisionase family DNA binding protein